VQSRPSRLSAHIHVDAPLHFLVDGREMAAMPVDQWVGEAAVVDLTHLDANGEVTAEDLKRRAEHVRPGDIVLLRTDWPKRVSVETEQFWKDGPWTGLSACEWLVARQVKAVGYDYPPGPVHPRHDRRAASAPGPGGVHDARDLLSGRNHRDRVPDQPRPDRGLALPVRRPTAQARGCRRLSGPRHRDRGVTRPIVRCWTA